MSDDSNFKVKSFGAKNKNKRGLKLGGAAIAPAKSPSVEDAQAPGGLAGGKENLLEMGLEFKLDLRAEDLKVINELGAGNGGTVSKVMHVATKSIMAKKVIHVDAKPAVRKQIVRELHIMHECHSPYIVSFYGAFLNDGDVVMCMEYMDCGSLDAIAKKVGPVRIDVLGKISEAVVEGLEYLYNVHRILHRDVKPSNILVNSRGQIKLCDFGVSGELVNSIADTFVGTSTYMSPERIKGAQYSVKSDVWSLGLSLLELAIGRFPFDADGSSAGTRASAGPMGILDLLQKIVNEPAPKLPKNAAFPPSLEQMIDRCLIKDPEKRPSPKELLSEPFMRSARATNVDLEQWACDCIEKMTGKPYHRTRTSVSTIMNSIPQRASPAPPRPISRDSPAGEMPPPPRRPSAAEQARGLNQHPIRTSSHRGTPTSITSPLSLNHERHGSDASLNDTTRNLEGLRLKQGSSPRPGMPQKSYSESTGVSPREQKAEFDKMEAARAAEKGRSEHGGQQGTIGIGFDAGAGRNGVLRDRSEDGRSRSGSGRGSDGLGRAGGMRERNGSTVSSRDGREGRESPAPEMVERRRQPPVTTMSSGSNGAGLVNGWERRT